MSNIEKSRIKEIVSLHKGIYNSLKKSLKDAKQVGRLLVRQKKDLKHGEFGPWIKANLPFTKMTAHNYVLLYRNRKLLKSKSVLLLNEAYKVVKADKAVNKAFKDYNIPKKDQKKIAKNIEDKIAKDEMKVKDIPKEVYKRKKEKLPAGEDPRAKELEKIYSDIDRQATALCNKIVGFKMRLEDLNVTKIRSPLTYVVLPSLHTLKEEIEDFLGSKRTKHIKSKQITGNTKLKSTG